MTAPSTSLDALARSGAGMREAVGLLRSLLSGLHTITVHLPEGVPDETAARERLFAGIPGLAGETLLSGDELRSSLRQLLSALPRDPCLGALETAAPALPWDELASLALAGEWQQLGPSLPRAVVDPHALATMLDWSVRPVLREGARRLDRLMRESRWARGRCPGCGSLPALAELRSNDDGDARILRCARCACAWTFPVLACPSCEQRDHRRLGWLHADGEHAFRRAEWCSACGFYVKAIATLSPLGADEVIEADLASAGLDLLAAERGYRRTQ